MPKDPVLVEASLHTIEYDGRVTIYPVQTYGPGGKCRDLRQAFTDFGLLEPDSPKVLILTLSNRRTVEIRHEWEPRERRNESLGKSIAFVVPQPTTS